MLWNTPLSEEHAELLLERLAPDAGASVLDLGCGRGELLLRAVERAATGVGVDVDAAALDHARAAAAARGLSERVRFVQGEATAWSEAADRAICIGAAHAFGGTAQALAVLRPLVRPGGRLLYGDGCWERPPTAAAASLFDDVLPLDAIVERAISLGWRPSHLTTADQREWDEFENAWRAGRPDAAERLSEYATVYRGVLGFCYLVLGR